MKFIFISVGKKHDKELETSILDYSRRISKYYEVGWEIIPSSDINTEAQKISKVLKDGDCIISLDERGKEFSSMELSKLFESMIQNSYKRIVFVIGGSYGLAQSILDNSKYTISLSKLTFPHQIVRLILAETVYRAVSIAKKLPYHHE